jgi:hypothetical protein
MRSAAPFVKPARRQGGGGGEEAKQKENEQTNPMLLASLGHSKSYALGSFPKPGVRPWPKDAADAPHQFRSTLVCHIDTSPTHSVSVTDIHKTGRGENLLISRAKDCL